MKCFQAVPLSSTRKTKKSFVIVVPNVDYNAIPDQLTVVPFY
jgi:hypothetical protein